MVSRLIEDHRCLAAKKCLVIGYVRRAGCLRNACLLWAMAVPTRSLGINIQADESSNPKLAIW